MSGGEPPERGEVIWLDFNPTKGHEQAGHRPALVVSAKSFNASMGICWVCPITSTPSRNDFDLKFTGNRISGTVRCAQLRAIDWKARGFEKADRISEELMEQVLGVLIVIVEG